MMPTLRLRPPARLRAIGLGTKPKWAMAASTANFLAALTTAVPFKMRDTVLADTPAIWATISILTTDLAAAIARLRTKGLGLGLMG